MAQILRAEVARNLPTATVGARIRSEHAGQSVISDGRFGSHHAQLLEQGERWPADFAAYGHVSHIESPSVP